MTVSATPMPRAQQIEAIRAALEAAFAPTALEVIDDSHLHVGHAGGQHGHGHFTVRIVSPSFAGLAPLARHRAVYEALGTLMQSDIHALSIRTETPGQPGE